MTTVDRDPLPPFTVSYDGGEVTVQARVRTFEDISQLIKTIGLLGSWVLDNQAYALAANIREDDPA